MLNKPERCRLCGLDVRRSEIDSDTLTYFMDCQRCGKYEMSFEAYQNFPTFQESEWLRCAARQECEAGRRLRISTENQGALIRQHQSTNVAENAERLAQFIARTASRPSLRATIEAERDYPIVDCRDAAELIWYIQHLEKAGVIEGGGARWGLTFDGWKQRNSPDGGFVPGTCFIAMSFAAECDFIYREGILPALKAARFEPVCMKDVLTNEDINFRILAELRKAEIVVADMTGQRPGVYFEAGFALALGRDVFWACKKNELDLVHFDTSHFQYIDWGSATDLCERLQEKTYRTERLWGPDIVT